MNLYFLVEGRSTEKKVYPAWLSYLLPKLKQVKNFYDVTKNNYYIFTAGGYPSIKDIALPNAIADINAHGKYNYLIVCLDADEVTVEEREKEIVAVLHDKQLTLNTAKLVVIVQNRCIETWFLGNRKIFTKNPQDSPLLEYIRYYDVSENDPELMGQYQKFSNHAQFHAAYLKELFRAKNIAYSKRNPGDVKKQFYLEELQKRITRNPKHLRTFGKFIDFCDRI
ncbi:MAG: hypothetical protein AB4290_05935 [Spirulina sp.]